MGFCCLLRLLVVKFFLDVTTHVTGINEDLPGHIREALAELDIVVPWKQLDLLAVQSAFDALAMKYHQIKALKNGGNNKQKREETLTADLHSVLKELGINTPWYEIDQVEKERLFESLATRYVNAKFFEIQFLPRSLIDDIESVYEDDYLEIIRNTTANITSAVNDIKIHQDRVRNTESKLDNNSRLEDDDLTNLLQEKNDLLDTKIQDQQKNAKERRKKFWMWLLMKKQQKNDKIKKIMEKISESYDRQTSNYKQKTTLTEFIEKFCKAIAETHQETSSIVAHAVKRIGVPSGFEFESIFIYGDARDEFLTILINAVGLRTAPDPESKPYVLRPVPNTKK